MASRSLKRRNLPKITLYLAGQGVVFLMVVGIVPATLFAGIISATVIESLSQTLAPSSAMYVGATLVALLLLRLLPSTFRDRLVHLRWDDPLPGSRAFTQFGPRDPRVNMNRLRAEYGRLPTNATEQNRLWYRIYKGVESQVGVSDAHQAYLALRDLATITYLLGPLLALGAVLLTRSWLTGVVYLGVEAGVAILVSVAAKGAGRRMVENVLAAASNPKLPGC